MKNLLTNIPTSLAEELIEVLVENKAVRIERIVSTGHNSPENVWYDQEEHEWVVVLKGQARLLFKDDIESVDLKPGDHINIPAHRKHRVEWTSLNEPTIWLAVFYKG